MLMSCAFRAYFFRNKALILFNIILMRFKSSSLKQERFLNIGFVLIIKFGMIWNLIHFLNGYCKIYLSQFDDGLA